MLDKNITRPNCGHDAHWGGYAARQAAPCETIS